MPTKLTRDAYEGLIEDEIADLSTVPGLTRSHIKSILRDSVHFYYPVTTRRYDLPSQKGEGWAVITIGEDGLFQAVSDYGTYGYWWTSHGCRDFREFLCRRSYTCPDGTPDYYIMSKLAPGQKYDGEETLRRVKRLIIKNRREWTTGNVDWRTYPTEKAREEWDLLDHHEDLEHEFNFHMWAQDTSLEFEFEDVYATAPSAQAVAFVTKTMPRLAKILRAELEAQGYWENEQCKTK